MKKRLISIMLSVAMVLTMIPMTGSLVYAADVLITEATATLSEPVVGDDGSGIIVSAPANANYTVEYAGAFVYEGTIPFPAVSAENPFQAGKQYGLKVRFTAKPGYYLDDSGTKYTINGQTTDNVGSCLRRINYRMPGEATTYNLATEVKYGHGSISASKPNLPVNSTQTVTFTPDDGYVLDEVTVNGFKANPSGNQLQVTMNEGKSVVATFRKAGTYHITTKVNGGKGRISDGERNLEPNTSKNITFTPSSGYLVGSVLVNGEEVSFSDNSISITVVDRDINVDVRFISNAITEATATVTEPVVGDDGSGITVSVPANANYTAEYAGAFVYEGTIPYPVVSAENPFQIGKTYGIKVRFIAKPGYRLDDSVTNYKINGQATDNVGYCLRRISLKPYPTKDVLSSNVTLSAASYTYDGKVKTPKVTIELPGGLVLAKDRDYTVAYDSGRKYVGEYNVKINGKGAYDGWSTTKTFTILPKKASLTKLTAGSDSIKAYWGKVSSQATGYELAWKAEEDADFTVAKISKYSTTSKTISNLPTAKAYTAKIRTYKIVGGETYYSDWSAEKSTVISPEKPVFALANGIVPEVTGFTASWNVPDDADRISGYELRYSTSSSMKKATTKKISPEDSSFTAEGLINGKTYYVQLRSFVTIDGNKKYSSWSAKKSVKTSLQGTSFVSGNSLVVDVPIMKVTWKPAAIESKIDGYQVRYSTSSSLKNDKNISVTAGTYSVDVSKLVYGKTYYFQVRTYKTIDDKMYYSSWCTKKSKAYKLNTVSYKSSGALVGNIGTFTASWKAPADVDNIDGYEVRYSTSSTMKNAKTKAVTGADTLTCKVENLSKRSYYVQVRSYADADGNRYYSSWNSKKKVSVK